MRSDSGTLRTRYALSHVLWQGVRAQGENPDETPLSAPHNQLHFRPDAPRLRGLIDRRGGDPGRGRVVRDGERRVEARRDG